MEVLEGEMGLEELGRLHQRGRRKGPCLNDRGKGREGPEKEVGLWYVKKMSSLEG